MGWIEMPQRGSLLPYRGVLSFLWKAREASGSEAARVHIPPRRRGGRVAAGGARAAARARSAYWRDTLAADCLACYTIFIS